MSRMVEKVLAAAARLPPFPRVAHKVLELLRDPNVGVKEQVAVVELDPNLTANVLKAVNSAYYALPRRVDNLKEALAFLGNRRFQEVVLTSASVKLLAGDNLGYDLNIGDLWKHSVATALMTDILCDLCKHKQGPALHTAALLHDIGKVVLGPFVEEHAEVIAADIFKGKTFLEAERASLEMDHAELGGRIAAAWHFSQEMVDLIRYHHDPNKKPGDKELAILAVSNELAQKFGVGSSVDGLLQHSNDDMLPLLKLTPADLVTATTKLEAQLEKAEALLSMR